MRENTKWIMLVTALAFVALMVFEWGMDLTGQSSAQLTGGEVGRVDNQPISYEEYITTYRSLYEQQQRNSPDPLTSAVNRQIEDAAFEQLVMQRLINAELRRRGIAVTAQEIRDAAAYSPPPELMNDPYFQTDGQFDLARYQQYLSTQVTDDALRQLEAYYRDLIPRSKLYFQVTAGIYVTDAELWRMWRDTHETATVDYLAIDPAALVPEGAVGVTDEEIEIYYDRNREDFLLPARASVRYAAISRAPVAADSAAALARAAAVRSEITGGADFAEVAERESADSVSAAQGGRLQITRGGTVAPFDAAAFSMPLNTVSEPILTQFGYHVLRVEERGGDSATVRHVLIPIERSPDSEDALFERADSLEALAETMPVAQAAAALGLTPREADLLPNLPFIASIGDVSEGTDWAFEEAETGDVSPVLESRDAYYVLELLSRQEERTQSLEEATPTIRAAILADKRLAAATERARQLVDRVRAGESLAAVAASIDSEVRNAGPFTRDDFVPGLGRFSPAIGAAFGLDVGETSGVVPSERMLYILRRTDATQASREEWEAQKEEQRTRVTDATAEQRWSQFLAALREGAEVEDLRAELERQAEAAAAQGVPGGIF